ncbi:hypothetical protein E4T56_gene4938 [Termitomyces sp. T112]|nr:hypothetical protein E4T56_gene4938 [Termitomyces sp. T112]
MASLFTTQGPLHDLEPVESDATPDADLAPPAVGQLSTSDGGDFCLGRPEILDISSGSSTIPKSSLDETRLATPVPASLPHDFPKSSLDKTRYTTPVPHDFSKSSVEESRLATPVPVSLHPDFYYKALPALPTGMAPRLKNDPEDFKFSSSQAYVAIDPFAPSMAQSIANFNYSRPTTMPSHVRPSTMQSPPMKAHSVLDTQSIIDTNSTIDTPTSSYILAFLLDTLPRQIYLYFLFTLPSLYFSRVARIFEEAELSMPDIKKMAIDSANKCQDPLWFPSAYGFQPVMRLKASWEQFIDSLTKEWKTLNLVSVLLLSAILTTLQIDGALTDPYTRYLAFLALVQHDA